MTNTDGYLVPNENLALNLPKRIYFHLLCTPGSHVIMHCTQALTNPDL